MSVFAIGVDEPHSTLSTIPCASAAFMKAGAVSGVKSIRMPPPSPANWYIWSSCEVASVTGRWVGKILTGMPAAFATRAGPPSAYAEIVSGEAIASFLAPALISACAAPTLL